MSENSWEGLQPEAKRKPPQSQDGYSPQEVALILGSMHFSGKKVRRLIRGGQLKASKRWGHWYIDPTAVNAYVIAEKKRQGITS